MKNAVLAAIVILMGAAGLGAFALERQAATRAEARAEAAEAATVRLEKDLKAWDIASEQCIQAISKARMDICESHADHSKGERCSDQ